MNVQQLARVLEENGDSTIRLVLPSGESVPDHFHVTEVGRIDKSFIDCGGTRRAASACSLQVWTANDVEHRLTAGKLAKILKIAEPVLASGELPVEVEYGTEVAAQYHIESASKRGDQVFVTLSGKQTDCLAKDRCGVGECQTTGCCS
jgi:hypothetical protein